MTERLELFIDSAAIDRRVEELARKIAADYPAGDLVIVAVLKGAFIFLADLVRKLPYSPVVDFVRIASYGNASASSGTVEIRKDVETPLAGKDVLIVEDIVDTGLSLDRLVRHIRLKEPRSVKTCALLDKPSRRRVAFEADYVGFTVEDHFLVGYGLDYSERHRGLPGVMILRQDSDG